MGSNDAELPKCLLIRYDVSHVYACIAHININLN